jgi:hypothetical protein
MQVVLLLGAASGLFSFCWDVHMDWGLNACVQVPTPHGRKGSGVQEDGLVEGREEEGLLTLAGSLTLDPTLQVGGSPLASSPSSSLVTLDKKTPSKKAHPTKRPSADGSDGLLAGLSGSSNGSSGDDEGSGGSSMVRRAQRRAAAGPPCGLRETLLFR